MEENLKPETKGSEEAENADIAENAENAEGAATDKNIDSADIKDEECEEKKNKEKSFLSKKKQNAELEKLKKENETLQNEAADLKERYTRLAAEYENYRKRTAKENETRYADAKADVWKSIINITDDFERALKAEVPEECQSYKDGVNLIYKKLTDAMTSSGIEEIQALGEQFDPNFHNAVMHIDSEEAGENEIVEVFEKGYRLGDKVIRCSMVKVAN